MNPSPPTLKIRTPTFAHHSLAFSPFFEDRIAVASGANFGLVGNGRVHILQLGPRGLEVVNRFDTQDCVYDVAWNESHENQVLAACGNGALRLFDTTLQGLPVQAWHEHSAEVMCVDWNNIQKDTFVTGSWDQSIKVWSTSRQTSLLTIKAHKSQIYTSKFSPQNPSLILTSASDGLLNVFDIRTSTPSLPIQSIKGSPTGSEVLDGDFNKYDGNLIASACKDSSVRVWDLRVSGGRAGLEGGTGGGGGKCLVELKGHSLAVRKVQWSPHHDDVLLSTSYDMTCRTWSTKSAQTRMIHSDHTEFVMGASWALFDQGLLASCAWDGEVHLFRG